jgi:hypothetical protein
VYLIRFDLRHESHQGQLDLSPCNQVKEDEYGMEMSMENITGIIRKKGEGIIPDGSWVFFKIRDKE